MKVRWLLVVCLVVTVALLIFGTGCPQSNGGGWFINERDDARVTFGFNAQPTDDGATGQFQLVDHSSKPPTRIHGTFDATPDGVWLWQEFSGECTIMEPGEDPVEAPFRIKVWDLGEGVNEFPGNDWLGDGIAVYIDGDLEYFGILEGGNIQVHWEE